MVIYPYVLRFACNASWFWMGAIIQTWQCSRDHLWYHLVGGVVHILDRHHLWRSHKPILGHFLLLWGKNSFCVFLNFFSINLFLCFKKDILSGYPFSYPSCYLPSYISGYPSSYPSSYTSSYYSCYPSSKSVWLSSGYPYGYLYGYCLRCFLVWPSISINGGIQCEFIRTLFYLDSEQERILLFYYFSYKPKSIKQYDLWRATLLTKLLYNAVILWCIYLARR